MRKFWGRVVNAALVVVIFLSLAVASGRAFDVELVRQDAGRSALTERDQGQRDASRESDALLADGRSRGAKTRQATLDPNLSPRSASVFPFVAAGRTASLRAKWPTVEAMRWQPPRGFLRQAFCVHRHESVDWYRAYTDWRGRPSPYSGGMQFTLSTWRRAGGSGHPHQWRPREQVYRAYRIWLQNGGSWREWGTAWKCGLS